MRRSLLVALLAPALLADTITLRNGDTVRGTFLSGDSRRIRVSVGDRVESYNLVDVQGIRFGDDDEPPRPAVTPSRTNPNTRTGSATPAPGTAPSTAPGQRRYETPDEDRVFRPQPAPAGRPAAASSRATRRTIPANTQVVVRMIDDIDSSRDRVGQVFRASLDEPLIAEGETFAQRGSDVTIRLVDANSSGRVSGRNELTVTLESVLINGRPVTVDSESVTQQSGNQGKRTATAAAGAAALGAIIGAIAGGGKGAAIGATTGGAVGAGGAILTRGKDVKIPSESRLTFALQQPIEVQ